MANKKKIVFILNPISGTHSKKEIPEIIERTLDHDQFDAEIKLTEYAGHASEIAKECANEGVDIVVAIGGDGTVTHPDGPWHHSLRIGQRAGPSSLSAA